MSTLIDANGKLYTDVIPTVAVRVRLQTSTHLMQGELHVRIGDRLKDELDRSEPFLAVTDAEVFGADGRVLFRAPFIGISRRQIVWVLPEAETAGEGTP